MKKLAKSVYAILIISLLAIPMVGCAKELTLTVWQPIDGAVSTSPQVYVKGKVSNPKATVTVNNANSWRNMKTGEFQGTVNLVEGENSIKVSATKGKKTATKMLTITYQPEQ